MSQIDQASFLCGSNATFIAELYSRYLADPASVDESWQHFFKELRDEAPAVLAELQGPDLSPNQPRVIGNGRAAASGGKGAAPSLAPARPSVVAPSVVAKGVEENRKAT